MRIRIPCIAALALFAAVSHASTFNVREGKDSKVVFKSKAAMETFEGKTDRMQGTLALDPSAVGDSITVHLEVDLASLDTGMKKRNQHMRDNHLETAKYPKAIFDGATVLSPAGTKLEPGKPTQFQIEGTFALHGVTRRLKADARATWVPAGTGGRIVFYAEFPVTLGDYSIRRPEFLFLKLAETQELRISGVAYSTP